MARLKIDELIRFVREKSPFYRDLYADIPEKAALSEFPVLSQDAFWQANGLKENRVLTGPMRDGVVFKSGGSTGSPKFSVFSKEEWKLFNEAFGRGLAAGGIEAGDRVVNIFYVGQLYGSFLFINKSLEESPIGVLQLPVGGSASSQETMMTIREFQANVIAGVPTSIMNLAEQIRASGENLENYPITKVLFGGEPVYPDQRERLASIFPGIQILSVGYASTDAGLLGYADRGCAPGEHRSFTDDTILEILDEETLQPINEVKHEGLVVVTNLTRTLMPIVRYPVGDRGAWLEPVGKRDRKFMLLGRSEEAARIGLIKLYVQDVENAIENVPTKLEILDFQMVIVHRERLDGLILKIATSGKTRELNSHSPNIISAIHRARPLYEEFVRDGKVHPIEIQWVGQTDLEFNARTGKLRRVIDRRLST